MLSVMVEISLETKLNSQTHNIIFFLLLFYNENKQNQFAAFIYQNDAVFQLK